MAGEKVSVLAVVLGIVLILAGIIMALSGVKRYLRFKRNNSLVMIAAGLILIFTAAMCSFGTLYGAVVGFSFTMVCSRYAYNKTRTVWLRVLYAVSAALGLTAALVSLGWQLGGCREIGNLNARLKRQQIWEEARMRHIGDLLAKHFPDRNILLVLHPTNINAKKDLRPGMMKALQKGLGRSGHVVGFVSPSQEFSSFMELGFRPKEIDKLLESRDDYNMAVFLVGLPLHGLEEMKFWQREDWERPKIFLASGSGYGLAQMLERKWISAALITDFSSPKLRRLLDLKQELVKDAANAQMVAEVHTYIDLGNIEEIIKLHPANFQDNPDLVDKLKRSRKAD